MARQDSLEPLKWARQLHTLMLHTKIVQIVFFKGAEDGFNSPSWDCGNGKCESFGSLPKLAR